MESVASTSKKLAVAIAVNDLVKTKLFDDLRIEDICRASGVSRSAFYRLFPDKYEIPLWCQGFAFDAGLREVGRSLDCRQGHAVTCSGLLLFKDLMISAAIQSGPYSFKSKLIDKHVEAMRETISQYKHLPIDDELGFQIISIAEAQGLAVNHWLLGDYPADCDTFASWLTSLTPVRLYEVLNDPANPCDPRELSYASIITSAMKRPV